MSTAAAPAPTLPLGQTKPDFGDWISPMLVKELRQGMRSRVFVISFLALQLAMVILAIVGLSASALDESTEIVTGFFWAIAAVPMLLIIPVTGLNAVGGEAKADTLELIFLTRLSARRIIFGKWVALVAQASLLLCAVLPYAMLRYFIGGINLGQELWLLFSMWFSSAVFTAVTVGLSPLPTRLMRILLVIGFVIGLNIFGFAMAALMFGRGAMGMSVGTGFSLSSFLSSLPPVIALMVFMMELGAFKLAPAAENHSTSIRVISFLTFLYGLAVYHWGSEDVATMSLVLAGVLAFITCQIALCERTDRPISLYRPFARWGFPGRLAGRLLYPGWPSGACFTLLTGVVWTFLPLLSTKSIDQDEMRAVVFLSLLAGSLLFPAALVRAFVKNPARPFVWHLVIYAACALVYFLASVLFEFKRVDIFSIARLLPPVAFLSNMSEEPSGWSLDLFIPGLALSALSGLVLLFLSLPKWREIAAAEKRVATWTVPPAPEPHVAAQQA